MRLFLRDDDKLCVDRQERAHRFYHTRWGHFCWKNFERVSASLERCKRLCWAEDAGSPGNVRRLRRLANVPVEIRCNDQLPTGVDHLIHCARIQYRAGSNKGVLSGEIGQAADAVRWLG